jgi:hypothetical protein
MGISLFGWEHHFGRDCINHPLTKWLLGSAISPFMVAAFVFLSQSSLSNPFHHI